MNPQITTSKPKIDYNEYVVFTDTGMTFMVFAIDYCTACNVARILCNEMGFAGFTVKQ